MMSSNLVVIVDYGMGNVGSLVKMFRRLGSNVLISDRAEELERASHLVLPGVGAFDKAVERLAAAEGLRELLIERVSDHSVPVLGVCLGMQLLFDSSEEGPGSGFGWIGGHVRKFQRSADLRVPHMGWNTVSIRRRDALVQDLDDQARFFFVHSFFVDTAAVEDVVATTSHGIEFASIVRRDNVMGVQFHPEKSHRFGMNILRNFIGMSTC